MGRSIRNLLLAMLAGTLAVACGGGTASPSPDPGPPDDATYRLRISAVQALPPAARFAWLPQALVTLDGRLLTGGAIPAIFPGPLLPPIVERPITPNGWARIVAEARAAGLLTGQGDFTGGAMPPGSMATRLELAADGQMYELFGDPGRVMNCITEPCVPQPGTPEAFAGFVNRFFDLGTWLGPDAGPEGRHVPAGYALLVGPPPDDHVLAQAPIAWPLDAGLTDFGAPLADGSGRRCGIVDGDDAAAIRPALEAATQITRFRDPVDGTFHGLTVRPLLPGDGDPCEALV